MTLFSPWSHRVPDVFIKYIHVAHTLEVHRISWPTRSHTRIPNSSWTWRTTTWTSMMEKYIYGIINIPMPFFVHGWLIGLLSTDLTLPQSIKTSFKSNESAVYRKPIRYYIIRVFNDCKAWIRRWQLGVLHVQVLFL